MRLLIALALCVSAVGEETAEVTSDPVADVKIKICPKPGYSAVFLELSRPANNVLAESIPDFEQVSKQVFDLKDGKQIVGIWGKPGTDIRAVFFFETAPNMVIKRFTLGGNAPRPPPEPKPDPKPQPDPKPTPKPIKADRVDLYVIEDPKAITADQAGMIREIRLAGDADIFRVFDKYGQDETGKQSAIVESYLRKVDGSFPYWFIVAVTAGKGSIVKKGELTSTAEVIDEIRQAKRFKARKPVSQPVFDTSHFSIQADECPT